jgi:hypothetical protein
MLRATYVDDSGTLVSTIGIAVMPSPKDVAEVESRIGSVPGQGDNKPYGLRPAGFPGTATDRFGVEQRQKLWLNQNTTPYVFFGTTGWADGRKKLRDGEQMEEFYFAREVLAKVMSGFLPAPAPCEEKSVRC